MFRAVFHYCGALWPFFIDFFSVVVGDPGIEPGVRLREGVTVSGKNTAGLSIKNSRLAYKEDRIT